MENAELTVSDIYDRVRKAVRIVEFERDEFQLPPWALSMPLTNRGVAVHTKEGWLIIDHVALGGQGPDHLEDVEVMPGGPEEGVPCLELSKLVPKVGMPVILVTGDSYYRGFVVEVDDTSLPGLGAVCPPWNALYTTIGYNTENGDSGSAILDMHGDLLGIHYGKHTTGEKKGLQIMITVAAIEYGLARGNER